MGIALLNVAGNLACMTSWFLLHFFSGRPPGRFSLRQKLWVWGLFAAIHAAVALVFFFLAGDSVVLYNCSKMLAFLICLPMLFFSFPKRFFQSLFIVSLAALLVVCAQGFGNLAELHLTAAGAALPAARGVNVLLVAAISAALLLPILRYTRRIFSLWAASGTGLFWRLFWLVPAAIFAFAMVTGNILAPGSIELASFIITRIILCATLILLLYLTSAVLQQSNDAAMAEEKARRMDNQLALQRAQYGRLTADAELLRTARHDMRHQMAVLKEYADAGDLAGLSGYLAGYIETIPLEGDEVFCQNPAVNAVARHYVAIARQRGVAVDAKLAIPAQNNYLSDIDLCIILGNLLENACDAAPGGASPAIRVRCRQLDDRLSLMVSNTYSGAVYRQGSTYLSTKHPGRGIGLSSVRAIADKYGGMMVADHSVDTFYAGVIVDISPARRRPPPVPAYTHPESKGNTRNG